VPSPEVPDVPVNPEVPVVPLVPLTATPISFATIITDGAAG
jgi:hypothetical protein